ncbi:MAG TPA: HD-GYP domain-containing protein [Lysinibacillus sp.]|jgi:putative nucleotidyltransferase with HDIG domain|uniref:HD-GYP domain-containing protein n=1 Tax=Lysinibacillus fusiformis TaxID=28031 RepID=A0A2I0V2I9_9BACI|nr:MULTISPECIES: HD-GYP domain-containing protein [Lysinibacillus]HBT71393.1 HD-GYP domain-containing protein [Lysinibacillus sp.]KUF30110.1 histidine kinase [Lysinibacillus sp. F5]MEE3809487.1 HD-GYP domain-containing protein [Lysinibacillus fusiformis]PKU52514.1 HD-GYP domain-containing protein [Lysinibacillus fusiformis]WCH46950.1 HD-GYP domain-containing protein [Lysinibacillus sp. OF-1]
MRLISIDVLKEGMVLGRTIWNEAGHPLLKKDVVINDRIIQRLQQLNMHYLYINDDISEGIEVEETVPPAMRNKVITTIKDSFQSIDGCNPVNASYILDQQSKTIVSIVDELLSAVTGNDEILTILTDAYLFDEYLYQHSFQVTLYSIAIAKELGYSAEDLRLIGIGALLHDVGKLMVPKDILTKPDRLTNDEFETMKMHARYGFDLLRNLHSISLLVAHCAFQHHERIDGSGYPRGLVDFEIHPFAKIIGVADVFDAVTTNRVYREKMLPSQGLAIVEAGSGTLYDARVVKALKRAVVHYPNGVILKLSDGRRGIVSRQNTLDAALPWIRIFEEQNQLLAATYEINLVDYPSVSIESVETDYVASAKVE